MKKYFVSFADSRLHRTLLRISKEAASLNVFDAIFCLNENDLDPTFWSKHKDFILRSPRGFGYWLWKPQVLRQTLSCIPFGSMLLYADAGCQLNIEGISRLADYWDLTESNGAHRLLFQLDSGKAEVCYTKEWTLQHFGISSEDRGSPQIQAGAFILKKTQVNVELIDSFLLLCSRYDLLDDSTKIPNGDRFIDHRHDQSIWSCLNKLAVPQPLIVPDETYWEPEWDKTYPIHARRWKH